MWTIILVFGFIINCTIGQTCQNCQNCQNGQSGPKISEIPAKKIDITIWPVWDDYTESLYFIDLLATSPKPGIYRYSYKDGMLYSAIIPGAQSIGFVYPVRQGCNECKDIFAIGSGSDVIFVKWDGKSPEAQIVGPKLFSVEANIPLSHTGMALPDSRGRIFEGPFSIKFCSIPSNNSLYRYTNDRGVVQLFTGFSETTGIAIDEGAKKLYHLDGCSLLLTGYDYDPKTGDICNGRVVLDFKSIGKTISTFVAIGLAIDTNGLLYIADYRNSAVYVVNPRAGQVVRVIDVGVGPISGLAFGGPKRDILYVVASSINVDVLTSNPLEIIKTGSSLYKITGLCAIGKKSNSFNLPTPCNGC